MTVINQKSYINDPRRFTVDPKGNVTEDTSTPCGCEDEPATQREIYINAQKEYRESLRAEIRKRRENRTLSEDITDCAKSACMEGVRAVSGVIHAGAKLGNSIDREIYKGTRSGIADKAVMNALFEKKKAAAKKTPALRVEKMFRVNLNGKITDLTEKQYKQMTAAARSSPVRNKRR